MKRTVFFVSESTGITAETLGHSLISQFDGVSFEQVYMPYINTELLAKALTVRMQEALDRDGDRPLVFSTILNDKIRAILKGGNCFFLELFELFIEPVSDELGVNPRLQSGRSHGITKPSLYTKRIEAINFAMANDDGMRPDNLKNARRCPYGGVALGQDADLPVSGHALRTAGGELSDHRGGLRPR